MKTYSVSTLGAIIVVLGATPLIRQVSAEIHHQRARVRCCLPVYAYDEDRSSSAGRVVCVLVEDPVQVSWPRTKFAKATDGSVVAVEAADKVRRKKFSPPPKPVVVGSVRLDQMGVFLYDTGDIQCTGRIVDESPPGDKRRGVNTTVIVRAYAGIQAKEEGLNGATMVWHKEGQLWVRNGLASTVSLLPSSVPSQIALRRHFDEITHLELELRYDKGR